MTCRAYSGLAQFRRQRSLGAYDHESVRKRDHMSGGGRTASKVIAGVPTSEAVTDSRLCG